MTVTELLCSDPEVTDPRSDLRLDFLLERLLEHSQTLLGTVAGSISLVNVSSGRYDKLAEQGITCRLGMSFPLDQGATGLAVSRRLPVVIDNYSDLRGGHLPLDHPVGRGAVVAAPMWWRGEVIGVNIAFAGCPRAFTAAEVDAFERLTQSAAPAVVKARSTVPSLAGMLREYDRITGPETGVQTVVIEAGHRRHVPDAVASAATDVVALVGRAASARCRPTRLRVAVVHRAEGLRLLVYDDTLPVSPTSQDPLGLGTSSWSELLTVVRGRLGGQVRVEHIAGWGTLLSTDFPNGPISEAVTRTLSPLTRREGQVLELLASGLTDREVAARLEISRKTVEKHVGAVLRKTDAPSRTAAVAHALGRGWLPEQASRVLSGGRRRSTRHSTPMGFSPHGGTDRVPIE